MCSVESIRQCSRSACKEAAVATLTYVYADSTAVLGPLAVYAEPHCYDLCAVHAERLTAPLGWEVVRLNSNDRPGTSRNDELGALVDAVRSSAEEPAAEGTRRSGRPSLEPQAEVPGTRRTHLRVLPEQD